MSVSWHDFIFGAFDPAGTITLDKLPGAFWIQALAVRALGFHTWVIILPHMVEGVLTVLVLYRAVSRLAGPAAGLIAALIVAASPATVALNRGNISDSLMILLLVLAADEVSAAIATREEHAGRAQALLILAAFWVGLAFQAKMIEAWLLLPALGLAYLLDGPGPLGRRVRQVVVAGILAGIVSLAWMTAVTLVPAANRPYADGSSDNSVYSQVFVYNGFGRFGDQTPVQLLASQLAPDQIIPIAPSGANRLFTGNLGRDTGWLLPAAFAAVIWGIARRGVRRPDSTPRERLRRAIRAHAAGRLDRLGTGEASENPADHPALASRAGQRSRPAGRAELRHRGGLHLHQRPRSAPHRRIHRNYPVAHPRPA